jgi:pimeloyl-ACP methyl ester carboxylesterase
MTSVRPFSLSVPDAVLDDLRERLAKARLVPDSPRRPDSGMSAQYLRALVDSWMEFDWRSRESWLNSHPQFIAEVDGRDLHFVHLRSANPDAPAILAMHGWPHTFALQLEFARLLPDFHVVLPSLPGFGFTEPWSDQSFSNSRIAAAMNTLMTGVLGYSRYLTYGEDISAAVNEMIAASYPDAVAGIIATHAYFPPSEDRAKLTDPAAIAFFDRIAQESGSGGGYAHEQATRPDTLAVALNDSPAGLLAWITEKLVEWSDTPPEHPELVENRISRERILTETMIYWVTEGIGPSFRPYFDGSDEFATGGIDVPALVAIQRHEHDYPESVARDYYRDLRTFERLDEGGHFAVAEVPQAMAARTRAFARELGLL